MKKLTLPTCRQAWLFLLFFAIATTHAQNYLISFAATGAATTLDSIKTENLTQGTSLTIQGGDVLHLVGSVGINDITTDEEIIKVSPNPMLGQAEISFYAKESGNTQVIIYDISGRKVLETEGNHTQGIQKYMISGLKQGSYFLKISGENYLYTSNITSINTTQTETKIEYIGIEKQGTVVSTLKSSKATIDMAYTTGDNLRFTGYSGTYNAIVLDVPTSSKTITFTFSSFTCGTSTVTDIDGNTYNTVSIGSQCWLGKNLNTTKYSDGTAIPNVTSDASWNNLITGAYCDYNNTSGNSTTYGRLYNWHAATDVHNICPTGWHVPCEVEWNIMEKYLDNTVDTTATGWVGTDIGGKLKETGTTHWASPNTGATNSSGFSALPGGWRNGYCGSFFNFSAYCFLWSSTYMGCSATIAWTRGLSCNNAGGYRYYKLKVDGLSVRCVKDN